MYSDGTIMAWKIDSSKGEEFIIFHLFCQFWKSLEVLAFKTLKHKGQALGCL